MDEIQALTSQIAAQRMAGIATCVIRERAACGFEPSPHAHDEIDTFVTELGFKPLGAEWVPISIDQALRIAYSVLRQDLAYGCRTMADDEARALAQRFLGMFTGPRCFTNGNQIIADAEPESVAGSSNPISDATFDGGVVCLDESRIGILWVEDED